MNVRVLLADDHAIVREGLRALVDRLPDMEVVGEADNGRTTVVLAEKVKPTVVIMDVTMPDLNGIDATRQLLELVPDAKVVALSIHSDKRYVSGMLRAGARGYLLKESAFEELELAIRTVVKGRVYVSPRIAGVVVEDYVQQLSQTDGSVFSLLSPREREVLQLIGEGTNTKEIARRLHRSVKTIETHRQNIMAKLGVSSVAELVKYAIREGLTTLE